MDERLQLYHVLEDSSAAETFAATLRKGGYEIELNPTAFDEKYLAMVLLSDNATLEGLFAVAPWLKEQYKYCSYPHLRLMPVFVYDSRNTDPEEAFEGKVGELYEELMSGEFKPFGFDQAKENPLEEFPRILEEYSE